MKELLKFIFRKKITKKTVFENIETGDLFTIKEISYYLAPNGFYCMKNKPSVMLWLDNEYFSLCAGFKAYVELDDVLNSFSIYDSRYGLISFFETHIDPYEYLLEELRKKYHY